METLSQTDKLYLVMLFNMVTSIVGILIMSRFATKALDMWKNTNDKWGEELKKSGKYLDDHIKSIKDHQKLTKLLVSVMEKAGVKNPTFKDVEDADWNFEMPEDKVKQ